MGCITLRRLTKTVANPKHDGRARYGIEAIKAFEEGTLCTLEQGDESDRVGYVFYAGSTHLISLALCADIALNIRTPEEVLALIDELNTALTQLKEGNFRCGGYCYPITVALHQVADACKQVTNTEDTV